MPTRKQRARRAKTFRHDYGFVVADEEGNEVEVSGADVRAKGKKEETAAKGKTGSKPAPKRPTSAREPQPPSWNRALKRGLPWGLAAGLGLSLLSHAVLRRRHRLRRRVRPAHVLDGCLHVPPLPAAAVVGPERQDALSRGGRR